MRSASSSGRDRNRCASESMNNGGRACSVLSSARYSATYWAGRLTPSMARVYVTPLLAVSEQRRPARGAEQAALPLVAQRQRVVHPGAGFRELGRHLARQQPEHEARVHDLLPEHDLAPPTAPEHGAEAALDLEHGAACLLVARHLAGVVRAAPLHVLLELPLARPDGVFHEQREVVIAARGRHAGEIAVAQR